MHELEGDAADYAPCDEGPEVSEDKMILIVGSSVIDLDRQVMDERMLPGRDMLLEQSVQCVVKRSAN